MVVIVVMEEFLSQGTHFLRDNKNTLRKISRLSPNPVKRTVGEIEVRVAGPVNIRGIEA